jgi:hypothetical protein
MVDKVMSLKQGMTQAEVEETLGIRPYDLKAVTDTSIVLIYVYRVTDRKTLSFLTRPTNGRKSTGKYVQLEVAYSSDGRVTNIHSCNLCPDNLVAKSKVDIEKIIAFITVTLPVILVYIGLQEN